MPRKFNKKNALQGESQSPSLHQPVVRPIVKSKQWNNHQIEAVMNAVQSGGGINEATRDHGVPSSTLKDRISGKVQNQGLLLI